MADKKKLREELAKVPEEKQKPKSKKDRIAEAVATIEKEFGVRLEPPKNIKFRTEQVTNFLKDKYNFRYNVINTDTEYKMKDAAKFKYFDDRDYRDASNALDLANISITENKLKNILYGSDVSEEFNPFMDYFNSIGKCESEFEYEGKDKEKKFIKVKHGEDWIWKFCQQVQLPAEDDRIYFVEGFRKWFTALVMSLVIDEPAMYNINQTCLIMYGGQGKYKTTWLKSIVPQHLQLKYFYGSSFQVHNKDHEKLMAYCILINFDEMASYNRTDIESVKSKISQDQIVVRLPYAKADVHLKRRASFSGTQNNKEFLKDETGSRRWFVIEIQKIDINTEFPIDKMYAQGLQHYKDGLKYWFDNEDIKKLEGRNEQFQLKTFEYELVQKNYSVPTKEDIRESSLVKYLTATDIATALSKDNNANVNNTVKANIGKALANLGFIKTSRRIEGYKTPVPLWCVKEAFNSVSKPVEGNDNNEQSDII